MPKNCLMTSPRAPGAKRAALPRASDYSKSFRKDWERLSHSGRFDMKRLKEVMMLLIANDGPLGAEWKDHALEFNFVVNPVHPEAGRIRLAASRAFVFDGRLV